MQPSKVFDRSQADYGFRQRNYPRPMRTATLSRRPQFPLSQLLRDQQNQQRWPSTLEGIQETSHVLPPEQQYTYGANFNTDFNAQFDELPPKHSPVAVKIESSDKKDKVSFRGKPRRAINKSFPFRLFNKMRPSVRRQKSKHDSIEYMPPSNLIRLFGETSLPGVRDIALSRSFLRRIFWICSFFFFGFLALRDISQLVSEYYTYPITVDVRLRDSRRLQFPAVTVCNLNIVRYSALCVTNVSSIQDSMIPRDLREKLCGIQPSAATNAKDAMDAKEAASATVAPASTVPPPPATTRDPSHGKKHHHHRKPDRHSHHPSSTHRTSKKNLNTTPTSRTKSGNTPLTTTASTATDGDGIDDINNYGVMSKNKANGNETTANGTEIDRGNQTASVEVLNATTTTASPSTTSTLTPIEVPNDISMPIPESENSDTKRTKRTVKNQPPAKVNQTSGSPPTQWQQQQQSELTQNNQTSTNASSSAPHSSTGKQSPKEKEKEKEKNDGPQQKDQPPQGQTPVLLENDIELTEREEKELQENLTNWLAVMYNSNEKIAQELGHQFEDFVLRCTIRSTNCTSEESFESFFTPTEGNCFTFKSQKLKRNYLGDRIKDETSIAGVNYGLEFVLNLEISEYLTGTTQIGAIIMIQHPDEIGNSASEAIFVAPQQSTYIGLKMVNISRLPKPYPEDCIDHWPTALIGRLTQNASYSQQACLKICLQRTIHTRCKCQSAMLPQLELNSTLKICDTRRRSTRKCVEEVMFQAEEKVSTCKCPPRCQVINYDKTVSMTRWPTREDKVTFDRGKANINFQNLAKVTVYFQTMTCQEVRQEKAYTTAKLFSSLGGILGMYVGFSFLSLFEILEVFVRRFWYFLTKKRSRFRAAVHTVTATFALNPKRGPMQLSRGFERKSETNHTMTGVTQRLPGRFPSRLNQTYHHGIV